MRSSADGQSSPRSRGSTNDNNNNSSSNENSGNSGSQYALCALGVGLVALGIVMIVWSVVPAETTANSGSSSAGGGEGDSTGSRKSKASSVAFVLVGSGVVMLLLSLCLGMRNKQREQQRLQESQNHTRMTARENGDAESPEEDAQRYAVPTYEEAVGSGQYPVRQSNLQPVSSQLPSYDDLVQVDGVQYEFEGSDVTGSQPGPTSVPTTTAASASNRKHGKSGRKLLPIKIRRIKSEKMHNSQPATGISIEPLTPPPQYEDKVPPL
ncbi:transmembrane protein 51a [Dunckerocampus dactyliophorus]|uniref:transmembrane protein 51a n=1 Tax=Dunckerocampus dactyliophorus TaxID=161453 RepID=UPI0024049FF2|nr:transmembrane protein 51a [Dunckerocampus dactyliophorus]XP_054636536.1 transmembrane protein 51a [Dunckerocampus dactyliophorus]